MAAPDLDKEYSPSAWSRRFSTSNQLIAHFNDVIRTGSEKVRVLYAHETLRYGPHPDETLHLFGADTLDADSPICVYIHGGYWQNGSKDEYMFMVPPMLKSGYCVAILGYSLCPTVTLDNIVEQIERASMYLHEYASKTGSRHLTFVGHSAGAHLIVCTIEQLRKTMPHYLAHIRHVFLVSGVYNLNELRHSCINAPNNICGLNDANISALSPLLSIDFNDWSTMDLHVHVYVAEHDSPTFRQQSAELFALLLGRVQDGKKHLIAAMQVIPVCDHFDIIERLADEEFELTRSITNTV